MDEHQLLEKIKEIIFSAPEEIYKFPPPEDCFDGEWEEASKEEKAFLLIEELLLNFNRAKIKKEKKVENEDIKKIDVLIGPRFYSAVDENMFFNALKSVESILDVKGNEKGLVLYCRDTINAYEKECLRSLLQRYQVSIPTEFQK